MAATDADLRTLTYRSRAEKSNGPARTKFVQTGDRLLCVDPFTPRLVSFGHCFHAVRKPFSKVVCFTGIDGQVVQFPFAIVAWLDQLPLSAAERTTATAIPRQHFVPLSLLALQNGRQRLPFHWHRLTSFEANRIFGARYVQSRRHDVDYVSWLTRQTTAFFDHRRPSRNQRCSDSALVG